MPRYPNQYPKIAFDDIEDADAPPSTFIRKDSDHANHHSALASEQSAITHTLGLNPQGDHETVKDRLEAMEAAGPGETPAAATWETLEGKPGSFPPSAHTHPWAEVTSKPTTFPPDVHTHAWADVTGKPTSFTPEVHTHDDRYYTETEVDTALSGKVASNDSRLTDERTPADGSVTAAKVSSALKPSGSAGSSTEALRALGAGSTQAAAGDDSRFPTTGQKNALAGTSGTPGAANQYVTTQDSRLSDARTPSAHSHPQSEITNLTTDLAGKASASHTHVKANISDFAHTHPASDLTATGTRDATTFLRGDNTWAVPAGGSPQVFPWVPLFDCHVNLSAAAAGLYPGHRAITEDLLSNAASPAQFAVVQHYIDPTDYAVSGKQMVMRVVASFAQNAVNNAGTSVATAGLYPVAAAGASTTWLPTYGTVIAGSTAARTGGSASTEARVLSSTFNAPAADTYALAVAISIATTAGATRIGLRLEYSYT